jgi:mandelate racemase
MKIRDVQVRTVIAPLDPPVRTASGHVIQAPLVLIDLATDTDVTGRSYLFGYHPFTLRRCASWSSRSAPSSEGTSLRPSRSTKSCGGG